MSFARLAKRHTSRKASKHKLSIGSIERPDIDTWDFFRYAAAYSAGQPEARQLVWWLDNGTWITQQAQSKEYKAPADRPLRESKTIPVLGIIYQYKGKPILWAYLCYRSTTGRWVVVSRPVPPVFSNDGTVPRYVPNVVFDVGPHLDHAKLA